MKKKSGIIFDHQMKVWIAEEDPTMYNTNIGIGHLILKILSKTPEKVTQIFADTDSAMTCREMKTRTLRIVNHLKNCGFKQNDIVGVMATNSENLAPVVFACLILGLPINALATVMNENDLIFMCRKTKPKLFICDGNIITTLKSAIDKIGLKSEIITLIEKIENHKFVDEILQNEFNSGDFDLPKLENLENLNAMILCSSGSTGLPKAVSKSHKQFLLNYTDRWFSSRDKEIVFYYSTISWITGIAFLIGGTIHGTKRIITTKSFSSESFLNIAHKYQPTTVYLPTPNLAEFIASKSVEEDGKVLQSIKNFICAGCAGSKQLYDAGKTYCPNGNIFVIYGTSEADVLTDTINESREGSVGSLLPGNKAVILDESNNLLGPNEVGEICYAANVPFLEYFQESDKTENAKFGEYFRAGDLGYFDDDGFLFIVGRKNENLKYRGYQVSPTELENLIDSIEGVEMSCVVGVFDKNTGNDLIMAFVKKSSDAITEDQILNYVNSKVIDAKQIRGGVHFVDTFPKTSNSGKIQRMELKKIAEVMIKF